MNVPQKLKELRAARRLKQADVAQATGITSSSYGNYESGFREISLTNLVKVADFYRVSTDYILGRAVLNPAEPERSARGESQNTPSNNVMEMYEMLTEQQKQRVYGIIWGLCALSGKDVTRYGL